MSQCRMKCCNNKIFKNGLCKKHYELKQKGKCTIEGCDGKYFAGEMCSKHYARAKRLGTLKLPRPRSIRDRLYAKVQKTGECLEWTGANDGKRYGTMSVNGNQEKVHRVAWELENGPVPEGMCVCHHCDNPSCIEISHLFLGTHSDNMQDCLQKSRGNRPGGYRGEKSHFARLTEKQVLEIRASDEQCNVLAKQYDISIAIITQVQKGQIWKHLPINEKHLSNKSQKLTEADVLVIQASDESNKALQAEYGVSKSTICRVRRSVDHEKPTKLTEKDVLAIRASNERNVDLAKKFNVTAPNISAVKRRETWTHI